MLCRIEDCHHQSFARGWCIMHYNRWWRTGHPLGRRHRKVDGVMLSEPGAIEKEMYDAD